MHTETKLEPPISIFLLAQHRLVREVVVRLLRNQNGIFVVGAGHQTREAFEALTTQTFDVLLLDSIKTLEAVAQMVGADDCLRKINVLLFGMEQDPNRFVRAVQLGACGYLLNDASASEMTMAVRAVAQGEAVCPPMLCKALFQHVSRGLLPGLERTQRGPAAIELTRRQRELMALVAKGMTNEGIAANLRLSQYTVKNHMRLIMAQLQAVSRGAAVDAIRSGGLFLNG